VSTLTPITGISEYDDSKNIIWIPKRPGVVTVYATGQK